ncbi:MAG: hypothetical protein RIB98_02670 [Acidimicrobiales bacterium]
MRTHLQGIALLGFLVVALWGLTKMVSPALSDALDEDGALQAESGDVVDLVVGAESVEAPLDDEERARLQFHLVVAGFLDDPSQVDGIIGTQTRAAMAEAADEWGLTDPSDREFLTFADEQSADTPLIGAS